MPMLFRFQSTSGWWIYRVFKIQSTILNADRPSGCSGWWSRPDSAPTLFGFLSASKPGFGLQKTHPMTGIQRMRFLHRMNSLHPMNRSMDKLTIVRHWLNICVLLREVILVIDLLVVVVEVPSHAGVGHNNNQIGYVVVSVASSVICCISPNVNSGWSDPFL